MSEYLFTSESVTGGHPDKVADQISDAVLDEVLRKDPRGRVACETMVTTGLVMVAGEITTTAQFDVPALVRDTIASIGYTGSSKGFDAYNCGVVMMIGRQSPDIARGVDRGAPGKQGAGDQGMMFGYATRETSALMPMPIQIAHTLARTTAQVRKDGSMPYLRPDAKTQVTIRYEDDRPVEVVKILISTQHAPDVDSETKIKPDLWEQVVGPVLDADYADLYDAASLRDEFLVNPTGKFVIGGPVGDAGLTGRKIIVDTYGGAARHGGGAFSGKDPSKVDRSAAYAARYVAKNVVAAGLADRCEVQLAYAIGVAHPVSIMVETFGTGKVSDHALTEAVSAVFDLRPGAFRKYLDLHRPIYQQTAAYGHFGREDLDLSWERTDRVDELRSAAGLEALAAADTPA